MADCFVFLRENIYVYMYITLYIYIYIRIGLNRAYIVSSKKGPFLRSVLVREAPWQASNNKNYVKVVEDKEKREKT